VILLGFLIFLLSLFVTIMISGKFQQVVKSIRKREGTVEGADVNRGGVIGTAFMLGLNNMRRRKVRTGLTCVTLVLITFVMICFTSVTTNLVDVEYPTGKAPSNGIVRRDPSFQPITDAELQNIQSAYGLDYPVSVERWIVGGAPTALELPERNDLNVAGGGAVTPEFLAVTIGLTVYTAAFVAEIVRSGIQSVPWGQTEAASALGLSRGLALKLILLPQALRVIIPPMTNQYLNLTKNSSLAVAVGYPDLVSISNTTLNQTGRAVECIAVIMAVYLTLSLVTASLMNWYNARSAIKER
jgi:ABC-type amino acid transport system permease subunit